MNTKYNSNKYGVYPTNSKYDNMIINEVNNVLDIKPLENFKCGNLNDKLILENVDNNKKNLRIKVLDKPYTSQKYFDNYYNYPLKPEQQPNNAIEQSFFFKKKQPLSYTQNNDEYPIDIYGNLINKYDNPYIYRHTFFNQNDARIQIYNYSPSYIEYKKTTNEFNPN